MVSTVESFYLLTSASTCCVLYLCVPPIELGTFSSNMSSLVFLAQRLGLRVPLQQCAARLAPQLQCCYSTTVEELADEVRGGLDRPAGAAATTAATLPPLPPPGLPPPSVPLFGLLSPTLLPHVPLNTTTAATFPDAAVAD